MKHAGETPKPYSTVFLCDIRSAQNAGAIFRTADAVGVSEVVLGGYTPGPTDRFGRERKTFTKSSLGSEKTVRYRHVRNYIQEVSLLKKAGAHIIALEQDSRSVDYKKIPPLSGHTVILLGNEVSGLSKKLLTLADIIADIPMRGKKESLNVSVAAGIVFYRWFDR